MIKESYNFGVSVELRHFSRREHFTVQVQNMKFRGRVKLMIMEYSRRYGQHVTSEFYIVAENDQLWSCGGCLVILFVQIN